MKVTQEKMTESESQEHSKLKILIVEDDFTSSKILEEYMSKYGECTIVANGADAVVGFRNALDKGQPYEVICLDILIPTINGHLVLKEVYRIQRDHGIDDMAGVKVIVTTVIDDSKDIMRAFNEGCDAYIVKPITYEELEGEMRKLSLIK